MKSKLTKLAVAATLGVVLALADCANRGVLPIDSGIRISANYKEYDGELYVIPPRVDTTGIKRIAVMPIEAKRYNSDKSYSEIASYATSETAKKLIEMGFTLVDTLEVKRIQASGERLEDYVDAIFSGKISFTENCTSVPQYTNRYLSNAIYSNDKKYKKANDPTNRATHDTYINTNTLSATYTYSITATKNGISIVPISHSENISETTDENVNTSKYFNSSRCPDMVMSDYEKVTYRALSNISSDFSPHYARHKEHSGYEGFIKPYYKNDAAKEEMDKAYSYLKIKKHSAFRCFFSSNAYYCNDETYPDYKLALEAYLKIYERHENAEAALNALNLYLALGEIETARSLVYKFYEEGDSNMKEKINSSGIMNAFSEPSGNEAENKIETAEDKIETEEK